MNRYDYKELRERAVNGGADDVNALGEWFEKYGEMYWNGEYYDADDGYRLFPIFETHFDEDGDLDFVETVGYEFK